MELYFGQVNFMVQIHRLNRLANVPELLYIHIQY